MCNKICLVTLQTDSFCVNFIQNIVDKVWFHSSWATGAETLFFFVVVFFWKLGLTTHDNTTPVRLIHNTAAHLQGASRTIGAIVIGCSGVRTFSPNPVSKLIECIGGVSSLLGLVAMSTSVEGLYASVKALSCVLRSNPSARRDMERVRGYQVCVTQGWFEKAMPK